MSLTYLFLEMCIFCVFVMSSVIFRYALNIVYILTLISIVVPVHAIVFIVKKKKGGIPVS